MLYPKIEVNKHRFYTHKTLREILVSNVDDETVEVFKLKRATLQSNDTEQQSEEEQHFQVQRSFIEFDDIPCTMLVFSEITS